jgi:hypothetical protein
MNTSVTTWEGTHFQTSGALYLGLYPRYLVPFQGTINVIQNNNFYNNTKVTVYIAFHNLLSSKQILIRML